MREPRHACSEEVCQPTQTHPQSSKRLLLLDSLRGYVAHDVFTHPGKHPNGYSVKHRNGWHWGTLSLLRHATALSGGNSIAFPIQGGGLWFVQPGAQNQFLVGSSFMGVFRHSWLLSRGGEGFSISASQRHQNPNNRPAFLIETSATSSSVRPSIAATPARLYRIFAGTLGLSGACAGGMSGLSVSMRKASG